ncbi:hypothetical protein CVE36_13190 [Pseudomonas syringae pv. actinidiae]|nr:hypothetical protein [Pseudomonas syringae pv. actinidiae]
MAIMQENMLLSRKDTAAAYWQRYLTGASRTANVSLVSATEREDAGTAASSSAQDVRVLVSHVDQALSAELLALAQRESVTGDVLMTAAWSLLLSKYSGEDEVLFGKRFTAHDGGKTTPCRYACTLMPVSRCATGFTISPQCLSSISAMPNRCLMPFRPE